MIEGVRERLLDAVRVRLRADVPVGIFLSGGLDSSTVAGMVKHLMVEKGVNLGSGESATANINCFCIKFMDSPGDEFDEERMSFHPQFHIEDACKLTYLQPSRNELLNGWVSRNTSCE